MNQFVISGRPKKNWILVVAIEQKQFGIDAARIHEYALHQADAIERSAILRVRKPGARASRHVLVSRVAHALPRELLEIVEYPDRRQDGVYLNSRISFSLALAI